MQQLGPIVEDRLARDGRTGQEPTWKDWTAAASAAGLSGILNSIGISKIGSLNSAFMKSVLKSGAREGVTEGAQEIVAEIGAGIGTDEGIVDAKTLAKRAYSSGLLGTTAGITAETALSAPAKFLQEKETTPLAKDEVETKTVEETQRRIESYGDLKNN